MAAEFGMFMNREANCIMKLHRLYEYLVYDLADPRSKGCLFIETPWPTLALLAAYLYFVLRWGPKFMKNRDALNIQGFIKLYNILQVIWNLYVFAYIFPMASAAQRMDRFSIWCMPLNYSEEDALSLLQLGGCKCYYYNKLFDLLDTVFFILRKKNFKATFLHIYHHVAMCICAWCAVKYAPGGGPISTGIFNSFIHVVMYTYYFLSLTRFRKMLWWKRYLTQLQMIQFLLILIFNVPVFFISSCYYNPFVSTLSVLQPMWFFYLFTEYYIKTYFHKKNN